MADREDFDIVKKYKEGKLENLRCVVGVVTVQVQAGQTQYEHQPCTYSPATAWNYIPIALRNNREMQCWASYAPVRRHFGGFGSLYICTEDSQNAESSRTQTSR